MAGVVSEEQNVRWGIRRASGDWESVGRALRDPVGAWRGSLGLGKGGRRGSGGVSVSEVNGGKCRL